MFVPGADEPAHKTLEREEQHRVAGLVKAPPLSPERA